MLPDKVFGGVLLALSAAIFSYYTLWVVVTVSARERARDRVALLRAFRGARTLRVSLNAITTRTPCASTLFLQPFVDADHAIQSYFPARKWAIAIPTILFVLVCMWPQHRSSNHHFVQPASYCVDPRPP